MVPITAGPAVRSWTRSERNERVLAHRDLVEPFVHKYANRGVGRDDLRQVAYLALVQAAERFDPSRGSSFEAFAGVTISGSVKRHFRDRTWTVRPPRSLQELHLRVRAADDRLAHEFGRRPTIDELARTLDVEVDEVHRALEAAAAWGSVSVDAPPPSGSGTVHGDRVLVAHEAGYDLCEVDITVHAALARLEDHERELLEMRFFDGFTQAEISERVGLSQSYVSRLISTVLASMRRSLEDPLPVDVREGESAHH